MDPVGGQRKWGLVGPSARLSLVEQHRRAGFGLVLDFRVEE